MCGIVCLAQMPLLGLWDGWQNGRRLSFVDMWSRFGFGTMYFLCQYGRLFTCDVLISGVAALIADRERF